MQENLFATFNNLPNFNKNLNTNFIDLFAGVGGIKIGFEQAGFHCVFSNDFDKNCQAICLIRHFTSNLAILWLCH